MAGAGTTSASGRHPDQVAILIREILRGLSLPSDCCIFTVSEELRRSNEEAYTPRVVAIGPYHRGKPSLKPMEDQKLLYLRDFLEADVQHLQGCCLGKKILEEFLRPDDRPEDEDRPEDDSVLAAEDRPEDDGVFAAEDRPEDDGVLEGLDGDRLEYLVEGVRSWEDEARRCYDRPIHLDSNEFAKMMLLDGIFVIQLFMIFNGRRSILPQDRIFGKPWLLNDVRRDMTLLENQIPFFIIMQLFEMVFTTYQGYQLVKLFELMHNFFHWSTLMENKLDMMMELQVKHIIDASRFSFLPSTSEAAHESNEDIKFSPTVTELVAAGVKLKRGES